MALPNFSRFGSSVIWSQTVEMKLFTRSFGKASRDSSKAARVSFRIIRAIGPTTFLSSVSAVSKKASSTVVFRPRLGNIGRLRFLDQTSFEPGRRGSPIHQTRSARADRPLRRRFASRCTGRVRPIVRPESSGLRPPLSTTREKTDSAEGTACLIFFHSSSRWNQFDMTCSVDRRTVRFSGDARQLKVTRPLSRSIMGRIASSPVRVSVRAWTIWPPSIYNSAPSLPLTAISPDFFPSTRGFTRLNSLIFERSPIKSLNTAASFCPHRRTDKAGDKYGCDGNDH